jgi:hypothetical protein
MARDGSGNYTLPAGNPVVADTLIEDTWANPTMSDLAAAMTDSLSRSGLGGMLAPFLNASGAVGAPGIAWADEPASGWYRAGAGDFRYSIGGVDVLRVNSNNLFIWGVATSLWYPVLTTQTAVQINAQTDPTYTLVLADINKLVTMTNASPNVLTVPPNVDVALAVGARIEVSAGGVGQTGISAGAGVTINSKDALLALTGQFSGATLTKTATDTWLLVGDLA